MNEMDNIRNHYSANETKLIHQLEELKVENHHLKQKIHTDLMKHTHKINELDHLISNKSNFF